MTIKEAILKSLEDLQKPVNNKDGRIRILSEYPLPTFYHPNLLIH